MTVTIREATTADLPGITRAHADGEGPWVKEETCAIAVGHRLGRPFHCHVAEVGDEVVGHAEWIRDPGVAEGAPFLYLGLVQIREDVRGSGIGNAVLAHGVGLARQSGCASIRTIPEDDVVGFYERCGFVTVDEVGEVTVGANAGEIGDVSDRVPEDVVSGLPMRIGWTQASSRHMWELCNRPMPPTGATYRHPAARTKNAWIQLRHSDADWALAVAWVNNAVESDRLVKEICALAYDQEIERVACWFRLAEMPAGKEPATVSPVLERRI